jgi:hypothetical protein
MAVNVSRGGAGTVGTRARCHGLTGLLAGSSHGAIMTWFYWDTFCSLLGSVVWFMTIVSHPDAEVRAIQDWRSSAMGGKTVSAGKKPP